MPSPQKVPFRPPDSIPLLQNGVTSYLNRTVVAWIVGGEMRPWPPRSPDLTPPDFSVLGDVKDKVFVPPLTASLEELRVRKAEAVATIDAYMIHRIWEEIAYRWDICRVTRGNHIEHL